MKKLILVLIAFGIMAPTFAMASESKCDCHAHDLSDACKKECAHDAH